jgi:hypothetical protein
MCPAFHDTNRRNATGMVATSKRSVVPASHRNYTNSSAAARYYQLLPTCRPGLAPVVIVVPPFCLFPVLSCRFSSTYTPAVQQVRQQKQHRWE